MRSNDRVNHQTEINNAHFSFVPMDLGQHISVIQPWFQMDYAKYWGMQGLSLQQTHDYYQEHINSEHFQVFIGYYKNHPSLVLEVYNPELDEIKDLYPIQAGDLGMHFFAGPCEQPIAGFTRAWMTNVMHFLFDELNATRVVVEPDINNNKIHIKNLDVGFVYSKAIQMQSKVGMLAFCDRESFRASQTESQNLSESYQYHPHPRYEQALQLINMFKEEQTMNSQANLPDNPSALNQNNSAETVASIVEHLTPAIWEKVNRHLVCKAIAEFSHEQLFEPTYICDALLAEWATYSLLSNDGERQYIFNAKKMPLRHWRIDKSSLQCVVNDQQQPLDALNFIIDFKETLAIPEDKLPIYLDEISSTLYGAAYKEQNAKYSSAELADADYQDIEAAMTEGHPGFVANNGRLGFDAIDYTHYAPETGNPFKILWIAVKKTNCVYGCIPSLEYEELIKDELGANTFQLFCDQLTKRDLQNDDYVFMPVHPWQWTNKISIVFSSEIAKQNIVFLGESDDIYKAQQSIRTYFNISDTTKHYVKTSLSILNMGFMRGLSPYYMEGTPKINAYLNDIINKDPVLKDYGFTILQEVAAVGYRNPYFEAACPKDNPCKKMLSALWRESPMQRLQSNEKLMTMTALLHVDKDEQSLLVELINKSSLDPSAWILSYLRAYLQPLLHCFYAYDLVFMPHGENLILVMEDYVPTKAIMKDIAEESAILNTEISLPEDIARLSVEVPEKYKILGIFIDVFDGYFRHMSHILEENNLIKGNQFWSLVADSVIEYQQQHPELNDKFSSRSIFVEDFLHSCLNRLQLKNNLQMVNLADPASSLIMVDPLPNPLFPFAPRTSNS